MIGAQIRQFFVKQGIPPSRIVAAVSGGIDSTALLLALAELRDDGFAIECAHINHHLRGVESDADEAFARELCARLDIPLHVEDGSLATMRNLEAEARAIRYERLQEIRERTGARYIATAHQKNDQAETVLMRLLTGSGISGLRGIHAIRDDGVIRPMLEVTRHEVEAELRQRGITARQDSSNDDPRFLRNRVRAMLRESGGIENLAAIAEQAAQQWPILERAIDEADRDCIVTADETRFAKWPENVWLRQALLLRHIRRLDPHSRDVSAADLTRVAQATTRTSVTRSLEFDGHVLRKRSETREITFEYELAAGQSLHIAEIGRTIAVNADGPGQRFQLPKNARATFTVRNRRPGDRLQPLGLAGSKKLKELLIDRKIPAQIRDTLPLLLWNGEIVWVAGVEVSEKFKITANPAGDQYVVWLEGAGGSERDQAGLQR